jgi:two-component system sensor histidine kinase UhpB
MPESQKKPIRVLVVEDREDDFVFLSHVFKLTRNAAYQLDWRGSYEAGLAALQAGGHDIGLFDYNLGAGTGIDLIREAQARGCTMPIVLLTGHDSPEIDEAALRAGAVDFMSKARLEPVQLERAIRYALRQAELHAQRMQAEAERRQTTQLLDSIMHSLPVVAGRIDASGSILEARGQGLAHVGIEPARLTGRQFTEIYPAAAEALREALAGGSATFPLSGRADGQDWHAEFFLSFDAAQGEGATFFGRDVSARRWLERRLLTVSDDEQQRIGADLHDGLGQQLTGLSCLAAALRDRLKAAFPAEAEQAGVIATMANEAIAHSRALARGLCPVQLENAGLLLALEELAGQAHTLHGVECSFAVKGPAPSCDHLTALHLYRITQEAITNAVRHGKARHIAIALTSTRGRQHRLAITDDGHGFPVDAHGQAPGGGLRLMGYRAAVIGGNLTVDSRPDHGTRITCHFTTFANNHESTHPRKNTPRGRPAENFQVAC